MTNTTLTPQATWAALKRRAAGVGWTITELCRRARVHRTTISAWRTGASEPTLATLRRLDETLQPIERAVAQLDGQGVTHASE